jgi:hypothetical protein
MPFPDAEKMVTSYLIDAIGARVVGDSPRDKSIPWVRLTQLDAQNEYDSAPEHLIDFMLQLDIYAGEENGQGEAHDLAVAVRTALHAMPDSDHEGGVVSCVRFTGMPRLPDTAMEPARQRYILTARVYIHS